MTGTPLNDRHPYEYFLLPLAFISVCPSAFGVAPPPGSVTALLDPGLARFWAVTLLVGTGMAMIGLMWPRRRNRISINALALEQVGLVIAGFATLIYSVAAFAAVGWSGLPPSLIVLAFGAANLVQAWKINKTFVRLKAVTGK